MKKHADVDRDMSYPNNEIWGSIGNFRIYSRLWRLSGHATGEVIAGMSYGIRVVYVHLDELVYFIFELVSAT